MICVCTSSKGVRSRRCIVSKSTSCSRQFSSPPVSCRYIKCRPSWAQANMRIPRSVSSVTTCACAHPTPSAPVGATQTLSTPSCGAIQASLDPSGEMRGMTRSGFPNRTRRGISSAMSHAYHVRDRAKDGTRPRSRGWAGGDHGSSARYDLPGAANSPEPANMTGGEARDALVIRRGHVLTMDRQLGDIPGGDVLVVGGRVVAVGPGLRAPGAPVLDARGMIVAPGLVDTHWHMWNTLLRSMSGGSRPGEGPGPGYFRACVGLGRAFGPDDMYQGTRLAC